MIAETSLRRLGDYEVTHRIAADALGAIYSVKHAKTGAAAFARVFSQQISRNTDVLVRHVTAILERAKCPLSNVLARGFLPDRSAFLILKHESALSPVDDAIATEPLNETAIAGLAQWLEEGQRDTPPSMASACSSLGPMPNSMPQSTPSTDYQQQSDRKPTFSPGAENPGASVAMGDEALRQQLSTPSQQQPPSPAERPSSPMEIKIPVPLSIARWLSREPKRDPVEQAFAELDPGWFSLDAPSEMQLGVAVKVSAGAIRSPHSDDAGREQLAATLEHDRAQLEAATLGRLVRVELIPDSEEDFQVRALSAVEQPVLSTEITRWEWLVTPRRPGDAKALRVIATNLADVNGQRVGKSRPVKTLVVRVEVVGAGSDPAISAATLRRICDETMRNDADLEAFCVDSFPSVHSRFGRGMDRVEKLNLLFSSVPPEQVMTRLREQFPEAVAAISARSIPPVNPNKDLPPKSSQPQITNSSAEALRPISPSRPPNPPGSQPAHIVVPIWVIVLIALACVALSALLTHR